MHQHAMNLGTLQPRLYQATLTMSELAGSAAVESGLAPQFVELLRIRVSQLNGCGFCLRMHTNDALAKGERIERIAVLPAWRETAYFDDLERDALALAERVTNVSGSPQAEQLEPVVALTPAQAAAVAWVAIVINAFNRIAITSHYRVAPAT
ncbi:carboxymuconolactone decarboxylase family protein [Terrabacter sp. RAF57]|uniref:carboxymuconolactone decarboxylase family protein n=1 Tax=Terrabacter sp. RAF57 TaxID=3233063 RepID=UPI003F9C1A24